MAGDAGHSLGKGNDKGYCLQKRQAMPVKALEKAMTRAIALFMSKPCLGKGNDKGYCLEKRVSAAGQSLQKGHD